MNPTAPVGHSRPQISDGVDILSLRTVRLTLWSCTFDQFEQLQISEIVHDPLQINLGIRRKLGPQSVLPRGRLSRISTRESWCQFDRSRDRRELSSMKRFRRIRRAKEAVVSSCRRRSISWCRSSRNRSFPPLIPSLVPTIFLKWIPSPLLLDDLSRLNRSDDFFPIPNPLPPSFRNLLLLHIPLIQSINPSLKCSSRSHSLKLAESIHARLRSRGSWDPCHSLH